MAKVAEGRLRVMLDANILIAGSVFPRWPYEVLRHALLKRFQLVLSPLVIEQARRGIRRAFPNQTEQLEDLLLLRPYELAQDPTPEELRRYLQPMLSGTFLKEVMGWSSEDLEKIRHRKWPEVEFLD